MARFFEAVRTIKPWQVSDVVEIGAISGLFYAARAFEKWELASWALSYN